ncbi:hypothetical protein G6F46_008245 [Rhizopus delemar]|uniref:Uncharacterized protein n=2 Tax=Rhizopus TaxID=4842 RepID=A0A9P6Z1D8_9FUNG|nr:hypothetical protein G6F55_007388 [Rhizopus delemar]KAG1544893.1 hypothetical protein G6F51_005785 [Rhizopus arrhizus]KAG1492664.1 hypothetical protein G6F54_009141 [Rhizopus delemar]KAG1506811.1 hypothetical protein G6F53_009416 [Rhizopus delemar]KAG1528422.1 hypothetical protein G6F52_000667 [Rhizopus delemar]
MIIPREHVIHSTNPYVPFYSYTDAPTGLYIFGTINLVLFGVCLGTMLCLLFRSQKGVRTASFAISITVFVLIADIVANTIMFIAKKDSYVQWCINTTSASLNREFLDQQQQRQFSFNQQDFYNCNRTWEDELKFTILCTILIMALYTYWAFCLFSYAVKLRINIKTAMVNYYQQGMMPQPMMVPTMNGGDIIL